MFKIIVVYIYVVYFSVRDYCLISENILVSFNNKKILLNNKFIKFEK